MNNVLVIGSLNMDMTVEVENIPKKGETILSNKISKYCGGKGANQAVAASKLGANTVMIGCVGNDSEGKELIKNLNDSGVDTSNIFIKDARTNKAWIAVDNQGDNSIIVIKGANELLNRNDIDKCEECFRNADVILLQMEIPLDIVYYSIKKAKSFGKIVILNPAPACKLDEDILKYIDYLTPNELELESVLGRLEKKDIVKDSLLLINKGIKNVITTLGELGVSYINFDKVINTYPAFNVVAVDSTGAGDCFNGALAYGIANNYDIEKSIIYALKASALSVTKKGAQSSLPTKYDVDNYKTNN